MHIGSWDGRSNTVGSQIGWETKMPAYVLSLWFPCPTTPTTTTTTTTFTTPMSAYGSGKSASIPSLVYYDLVAYKAIYRVTLISDANGTGLNMLNVPNSGKHEIAWLKRTKNDVEWVYHQSERRKTTMNNWSRSRCVTTGSTLTPMLARYKLYKVDRQAKLQGSQDFTVKLVISLSRIVRIISITSMVESVSWTRWINDGR